MEFFITFWGIVAAITIGLSLPPALRTKSWKRFFLAAFLAFAGILFPLFVFLMSMFIAPEWKGGCHHGWLDCFHIGKLALAPLVLWASAAFYTAQVLKSGRTPRAWVDLGIFIGAVTSTTCFILGLVIHGFQGGMAWWLLVPLYVSTWYAILCIRVIRSSRWNPVAYLITLAGSLPLWAVSMFWSKRHYLSLPDNPPGCFVVTAALRGHEWLVGPLSNFERCGMSRVANSQLATFWRFESLWALHCPRTHRVFRRFYNRLGPRIASRVTSPLTADFVYCLLKPLELFATAVVNFNEKHVFGTVMLFSRRSRRLALILLLGGIVVCGALGIRRRHFPQPVPTQVQSAGMAIIKQELNKLADSSFGRSERGRALLSEIERLIEADVVVFSSGLGGPRGLTLYNVFRTKRVYLKVIEMNHGRYLHQLPWQLSEVLFHEALHSLRAELHSSSFEEECDAFAAGLQAEAASRGNAPDSVFRMDGLPVAEFVKNSYPGIRHDPGYHPVGESLEWLKQHVGGGQDPRHSIECGVL